MDLEIRSVYVIIRAYRLFAREKTTSKWGRNLEAYREKTLAV
ncbi:hypothetical protein [Leptospira fletcheri]|nr:hypothetical protein [Leptospira fletcheri]